jgi:PAS domain S-box-containing protein
MRAPLPVNESERLKALRRYRILDTGPEAPFDDLTMLAAEICETPVALISLVDECRQWFKSKVGLATSEISREVAFCAHAILQPDRLLVATDTLADKRFADNPLVTGTPKIRFYAGAPLVTHDGHALGTLCVMDFVPRRLSKGQERVLLALGRQVVSQLELRYQPGRQLERLAAVAEATTDLIGFTDPDGHIVYLNGAGRRLLGIDDNEDLSKAEIRDYQPAWAAAQMAEQAIPTALRDGIWKGRSGCLNRDGREIPVSMILLAHRSASGALDFLAAVLRDISEDLKAEEEIRRLARQNRMILKAAGEGICGVDRQERITFINPAAARMLGWEPEEIQGRSMHEIAHHTRADGAPHPPEECPFIGGLKDGALSRAGIDIFWRKDGRSFPAEFTCNPTRDEQGAVTGAVITLRDIAKRQEMLATLKSTASRLRTIINTEPECVKLVGADGTLLEMNPAGLAMIEADSEARAIGQSIYPMVASQYRDRFRALTEEVCRGGTGSMEFEIVGLKGTHRWLDTRAVPFRNEATGETCLLGVTRDITQRRRAEEALRETQEELEQRVRERTFELTGTNVALQAEIAERSRAAEALREAYAEIRDLYDKAPCGYHSLNKDGLYVAINDTELQWLGYRRDEVIGKLEVRNVLTPEGRKLQEKSLPLLMEQGSLSDLEFEMVRKDGTTFPVLLNATAVRDASGKFLMTRSTIFDISARKRAETALLSTNAQLESFAYSVSHDLRAPARAMEGFSTLLLEDYGDKLDPDGRDYLRRISEAAKKMDVLIEDLLAYSRLGRLEFIAEPVSLDQVLDEVLAQLDPQIEGSGARVTRAGDLPAVIGHRPTLNQVITNLLSNAIKYVSADVRPCIDLGAEVSDGRVRLWVRDNGIGIPREHQERIFRVFERLYSAADYPGTGIGLAIVQKGVERMEGRLGVESEPGKGSLFWVELPAA